MKPSFFPEQCPSRPAVRSKLSLIRIEIPVRNIIGKPNNH